MRGKIPHLVGEHPVKVPDCSKGLLEEMFGLRVCRSSHFNLSPNSEVDDSTSPYFPLNGPAFYTVKLEKANPSLLSTKFVYAGIRNEVRRVAAGKLLGAIAQFQGSKGWLLNPLIVI